MFYGLEKLVRTLNRLLVLLVFQQDTSFPNVNYATGGVLPIFLLVRLEQNWRGFANFPIG
jgi:hypothetical protein